MLKELLEANQKFISIMKEEEGVLASWYFGSVLHHDTDEHSDIDIIFLVDSNNFDRIDRELISMLQKICEEVVMEWAEDFNSESIKNYGYLLKSGEYIFQYDVFLLNQDKIDDFMCQIHYADLQKENIIFDYNHQAEKLINIHVNKDTWGDDVHKLIQTYWFHVHMTAKYFTREDFFKLEGVLRILLDTHISLLLTFFDKITWGGSASKLHYIPEGKQKHLMKYGCMEDFQRMKDNLLKSMQWFLDDVAELCDDKDAEYNSLIGNRIRDYWIKQMG